MRRRIRLGSLSPPPPCPPPFCPREIWVEERYPSFLSLSFSLSLSLSLSLSNVCHEYTKEEQCARRAEEDSNGQKARSMYVMVCCMGMMPIWLLCCPPFPPPHPPAIPQYTLDRPWDVACNEIHGRGKTYWFKRVLARRNGSQPRMYAIITNLSIADGQNIRK